ncbi:sensor histidine kinase [Streptomyces sp. CB02400]|uniref:sensor histidine kinase n=1 Tax=unclassified Streptomyces TaxID=2593676 RepID=UPI0009633DB7|nr:ATP-binding protein [Streptomyces sp. CB02400]OKK11484.1 histidine kinase [Streptomyces sp. CB02400]
MTTTRERTGLFRRAARLSEITTPPAGTVLPPHARTGAPDIPVTSVTPALPPGWEPAGGTQPRLPEPSAAEAAGPSQGHGASAAEAAGLPRDHEASAAEAAGPPQDHGVSAADGAGPPQGPPVPDNESRTGGAGGNPHPAEGRTHPPQPAPRPDVQIQINALQALCRQAFGFRLAMIALATPSALLNAAPGWSTRLVAIAVVATFMASYVLFRDWERFGPLLLRHPTLLAADTLFGALLLISAGPDTTLAYVSVCTPLLAGLIYGWRGAAVFASLQGLILLLVHAALDNPQTDPAESLLLPGLCVIAGAVGSSLRNLMLRLGTATRALTTVQARLAVTEAVSAERARLAREMHDSVAKTLHGVALAADGLAGTAGARHMDTALVKQQAELVARSARRAAAESRELLADLRRESDPDQGTDVLVELAARTRDFTTRTGVPATYRPTGEHAVPPVPPAVARQLLTIASEAMENAHRHGKPTKVDVHAGVHGDLLRISVYDDGTGLPPGTDLEQLRRAGHFGLVGMVERAASVGARIRIGRGAHTQGTEVRLELPLAAVTTPTEATP